MHIICDHYEDYFELTGESLLKVSDEITESVHSRYRLFEEITEVNSTLQHSEH